mgnify:CR=1 FL=1
MPERSNVNFAVLEDRARFIRTETVRLSRIAGAGHYSSTFSCAEILSALYYAQMRIEPSDPDWANRDRFVMSKGHAAIGLYPVLADLGYYGRQGEHMEAVFNSPERHHLVVCTLCSCYPWSVLGLPPTWYKSPPYRSKAVIDPRGVLADFGVKLSEGVAVEVHDSTAETRYLVVPDQPEGTDGWNADQLEKLVTRNSMIGTGLPLSADEA